MTFISPKVACFIYKYKKMYPQDTEVLVAEETSIQASHLTFSYQASGLQRLGRLWVGHINYSLTPAHRSTGAH